MYYVFSTPRSMGRSFFEDFYMSFKEVPPMKWTAETVAAVEAPDVRAEGNEIGAMRRGVGDAME